MSCPTGKRSFDSLAMAEEALVEHHVKFNHPKGTGPVNVYQCEDCGEYHFTSKGPVNDILEERKDYIKREQEVRKWEQRLR